MHVWVCVHVGTHTHIHTHVCAYIHVEIRDQVCMLLFESHITYFFENLSLTGAYRESYAGWPVSQGDLLISASAPPMNT